MMNKYNVYFCHMIGKTDEFGKGVIKKKNISVYKYERI